MRRQMQTVFFCQTFCQNVTKVLIKTNINAAAQDTSYSEVDLFFWFPSSHHLERPDDGCWGLIFSWTDGGALTHSSVWEWLGGGLWSDTFLHSLGLKGFQHKPVRHQMSFIYVGINDQYVNIYNWYIYMSINLQYLQLIYPSLLYISI